MLGGSGHGAGHILAAVWHLAGDRKPEVSLTFLDLGCCQAKEFNCQRTVISPFAELMD